MSIRDMIKISVFVSFFLFSLCPSPSPSLSIDRMYVNQEILGAQMLMISCYANFQAQFPLEAHRKKNSED